MTALVLAALIPFGAAALINAVSAPRSIRAGLFASASVVTCFALVASQYANVLHHPVEHSFPWVPSLGLNLSLYVDGLSLLFALLITGIGSIVFTFATAYLGAEENRRRFFCYLLLFMGAMMGVVFSGNLIGLFIFWELTSISSFLLIGFWHPRDRSRNGALKALVITSCGGLAMLVGFLMIGITCGSYELSEIFARRELLTESPWASWAAGLILIGAMTKSAQLPFHLWLPSAMEAPTPVSAFLHAATMVKAGLFLVARLGPAMHGIELWTAGATSIGLATMAWGSWMALRQKDLKGLLAFSTVSQLGLIMSLLAVGKSDATAAGLFHLLNHGVFKGALFLLVGVIEHEAHTRDLTELGPLRDKMPRVHTLLALGALSMAGVPPFGGFVSKELFLEWHMHAGPLAAAVAVGGSILTAAYCFALVIGLARGRGAPTESASHAHDPGISLLWGPAVLVALSLAIGFFPQAIAGHLVESATGAALAGEAPHLHLALWHGLNPALAGSTVAILGGFALYNFWWQPREITPSPLVADRAYEAFLAGLERSARATTGLYMSGLLWRYLTIIFCVGAFGVAAAWLTGNAPGQIAWHARAVRPVELLVAIACGGAALAAVRARTRLSAILALGANGFTVALLFSLFNAPDLALTQVMVETISVALFLSVFVFLPPFRAERTAESRPLHAVLAGVTGFGIAALVYLTRGARAVPSISDYFLESSVEQAGGHNVVNVILVDFRGLDTMGEITVLGVAALAGFAIIKTVRRRLAL